MNTTQNITYVGPGSSCSYLGSRPAPIWQETNSTAAACSVANCRQNALAIQKCCTDGTIKSFNHTIPHAGGNTTVEGQYLYCALPNVNASSYDNFQPYDPQDPYQAYQDCLVREGTDFLVCNQPSRYQVPGWEAQCFGSTGSITTAGGIAANESFQPETLCTVNTNVDDSAGNLLSCCVNSNGAVRAEQAGCQVSCSGDFSLQSCLEGDSGRGGRPGFPYLCSNYSRDGGDAGGAASDVSSVGSGKLTLAGVLVLSTVLLATL